MQKILMYPDFGEVCFWHSPSGALLDIDEFEPYLLPTSQLYKNIKEWCKDFQKCESENFNWDEFNKKGLQLHKELIPLLKDKYIIEYIRSYEETEARK
jgi:hypothetical protein